MQVARWGNALAVRLPAALVREMGLREGDDVELRRDGAGLAIARRPRPEGERDAERRARERASRPAHCAPSSSGGAITSGSWIGSCVPPLAA